MQRRAILAGMAAAAGAGMLGLSGQVKARAGQPIRLITPHPPGGPTDTAARRLAEVLGRADGNIYVVDNRTGAGGSIASAEVARATPDGLTLGIALRDTLINSALTQKNPGYDPLTDLTMIAQFTSASPLIIVDPDLKVGSMDELVALAKARPGGISYGSWGAGSAPHLIMAALEQVSGAEWLHIPYRGAMPALQDLVGKQVQIGFVPDHVARIYLDKGWGVPVAVAGPQRVKGFPDVPTLAEQGYDSPITRAPLWMGVIGPKGLAPALVRELSAKIEASLHTEAFVQALAAMSHVPDYQDSKDFDATVRGDHAATAALLKSLNIQPE